MTDDLLFGNTIGRGSLATGAGGDIRGATEGGRVSYMDKYSEDIAAMQKYEDSDDDSEDEEGAQQRRGPDEQKSGLAFETQDKFKKSKLGADFGDVIDNEDGEDGEDGDGYEEGDGSNSAGDELI